MHVVSKFIPTSPNATTATIQKTVIQWRIVEEDQVYNIEYISLLVYVLLKYNIYDMMNII